MTTTDTSDRFTTLPDDQTLAATVGGLEEHGFSVEMVDDLAAARNAVLARIPHGPGVHQPTRSDVRALPATRRDRHHRRRARSRIVARPDRGDERHAGT